MNKNLLAEEIGGLLQMPEGIPQMRHFILNLAIRGKLMPQNSKDESAAKLLTKIAAEKKKLVRAGKIKPSAALPPIADGEIPFAIPNGWEWVRINEMAYIEMGQSPKSIYYNQLKDGLPFYQGKADFGKIHPSPRYWCSQPKKIALPNDILISVRAPIGPTNVASEKCCIGRGLAIIRPYPKMCADFVLLALKNLEGNLAALGVGTTFTAIKKDTLVSFTFPIPPLAEQKRIVAKVNQLMACCDKLEEAQKREEGYRERFLDSVLQELTDTSKSFVKSADFALSHFSRLTLRAKDIKVWRKSILDLAVQGKLMPQNSKDESAAKLLVKIAAEKKKLVRAGKIKPSADLPPIADDEIPFAIPNGWEWVRFSDLAFFAMGKTPPRKEPIFWNSPDYSWVSISDMEHGGSILKTKYCVSESARENIFRKLPPSAGTLLMSFKLTIGKISRLAIPAYHNEGIISIYTYIKIMEDFLFVFLPLFSQFGQKRDAVKGKTLNMKSLSMMLIALPPLAEQKRIVAKVKELMACCDKLEAELSAAEDYRRRLARTLLAI